jgi:DUF438 domain-containing protein
MSEIINSREQRQAKLKELIMELHEGATVNDVKEKFAKLIEGVSASEITQMEQALVNEGMPVSEIQKLCDVHASVFKGSIEEIHAESNDLKYEPGHPINTFELENRKIEELIDEEVLPSLEAYKSTKESNKKEIFLYSWEKLMTIERHYSRKENLLFPYMEKYDITAPPQVMWGVDDEIREGLKLVESMAMSEDNDMNILFNKAIDTTNQIKEMIFKEENIMFPMVMDTMNAKEWEAIEEASSEIGFTLLKTVKRWQPRFEEEIEDKDIKTSAENIQFDAGNLSPEEINSILNTVPLDMTFVDANNRVKYFTQGKERIFDRAKTIIGREVKNCHPPKSVHIVEKIVEDLRSGIKDHEDFWIEMGGMFVYIRYFAVRNDKGEFLGTLEVTQDIKPIQELEGEKRLMSEG